MFDVTDAFSAVIGEAEGQLGEDGTNRFNNCVPTSFIDCLQALGYADVEPQDWTDAEYGPTYHGGTSYAKMIDFVHSHPDQFPNPPVIAVSNPRNTLSAIDGWGQLGWPVVVQFHGDANGNIVTTPSPEGFFHVCPVLRVAQSGVTVLNVWQGTLVTLDPNSFARATLDPAGWCAVFQRPVPSELRDLRLALADMTAHRDQLAAQLRAQDASIADLTGRLAAAQGQLVAWRDYPDLSRQLQACQDQVKALQGQVVVSPVIEPPPPAAPGPSWLPRLVATLAKWVRG